MRLINCATAVVFVDATKGITFACGQREAVMHSSLADGKTIFDR